MENLDQEREFHFGTLRQWCAKFLARIFYRFGRPTPENSIWSLWPWCDQMVLLTGVRLKPGFGTFEVRPWVKFSKFWPGDTSDLYANGPKRLPPGFFTYFRRPTAENSDSVVLIMVRPNGAFERRTTKIWPRSFWDATMGQMFKILTCRDFWPLRQRSQKFPSKIFYSFWASTAENYESVFLTSVRPNGAFDQRATKMWVRSSWGATIGQIFKILTRRDFWPLRQWSRPFPHRVFYPY